MTRGLEVTGIDEITKVLEQLLPRHAANLSKAMVHGLASEVTKEAKKRVPKKTGTLGRAIKAKRRRGKPGQPVSDVIVESGKTAKFDGFYWRFIEFGTGGPVPQPEQPFLRPAKDLIQANIPRIAQEQFVKKLAAAVKREQKKIARR
ncbi:MAG: HK97 gp10 family phage protein [Emcibacter sp.]|nr:HK97 gp10 family phage protein [Emcibacter sp.]